MISQNKYGKYSVPDHNTSASRTIRSGGIYEPETIKYILNHCRDGNVIHCGAYFGDFLPALGKIPGTVFAFEPNMENYNHAKETIVLNGLENIHLRNVALSDKSDILNIKVKDGSNFLGGGSHLVENETNDTHKIKSVSIDELELNNISLIHLDVEGHEEKVILGAIKTIQKYKPILIVENLPSKETFNKLLKPLGYQYSGKIYINTLITIQ